MLVGFAFGLDVARKRIGLREENGLLEAGYLRADVKQLQDLLARWWRVALQAEHLKETALFALPSYQHLQHFIYITLFVLNECNAKSSDVARIANRTGCQ